MQLNKEYDLKQASKHKSQHHSVQHAYMFTQLNVDFGQVYPVAFSNKDQA